MAAASVPPESLIIHPAGSAIKRTDGGRLELEIGKGIFAQFWSACLFLPRCSQPRQPRNWGPRLNAFALWPPSDPSLSLQPQQRDGGGEEEEGRRDFLPEGVVREPAGEGPREDPVTSSQACRRRGEFTGPGGKGTRPLFPGQMCRRRPGLCQGKRASTRSAGRGARQGLPGSRPSLATRPRTRETRNRAFAEIWIPPTNHTDT
uniref:Uncharacterized protein n=1 Tax=Macaca fascicularis TaxID=9541 RepID=A0A7N9CE44_MACFA